MTSVKQLQTKIKSIKELEKRIKALEEIEKNLVKLHMINNSNDINDILEGKMFNDDLYINICDQISKLEQQWDILTESY